MTEADWLASDDPEALLAELPARVRSAKRKWRLFGLACLEPFRPHFPHADDYSAVLEMLARDAEREWTFDERCRAQKVAGQILQWVVEDASEQRWHYIAEALAEALFDAVEDAWEKHAPYVAFRCGIVATYLSPDPPEDVVRRRSLTPSRSTARDLRQPVPPSDGRSVVAHVRRAGAGAWHLR
jgi:hypothetical protein